MIPVSEPDIGSLEIQNACEALTSGWLSGRGPFISRFEGAFAEVCGMPHVLTTSSGTTALHLALLTLGIRPGDEVIVPAFCYVAAANAVRYVGASPVLVDVCQRTWGIDPESVENAITERTRAIVAVHNYGIPCDIPAIRNLADRHAIPLVEDAAEALAATIASRPAGSWGDISTFSFYGNKIMTGGEGGILASANKDLVDRARFLANQAMSEEQRYFFPEVGYNYRMTNVTAAILLAQLTRLDEMLASRRDVWAKYVEEIGRLSGVTLPPNPQGTELSPWLFGFVLDQDYPDEMRNQVAQSMLASGVETRPFFFPLHRLPSFSNCPQDAKLSVSEWLGTHGLSLPTHSRLSLGQQERVIEALHHALGR